MHYQGLARSLIDFDVWGAENGYLTSGHTHMLDVANIKPYCDLITTALEALAEDAASRFHLLGGSFGAILAHCLSTDILLRRVSIGSVVMIDPPPPGPCHRQAYTNKFLAEQLVRLSLQVAGEVALEDAYKAPFECVSDDNIWELAVVTTGMLVQLGLATASLETMHNVKRRMELFKVHMMMWESLDASPSRYLPSWSSHGIIVQCSSERQEFFAELYGPFEDSFEAFGGCTIYPEIAGSHTDVVQRIATGRCLSFNARLRLDLGAAQNISKSCMSRPE